MEHVYTPDRESLTSQMLLRMESTEKCEAVITHFNGKYIKTPPGVAGESSGTRAGGHWRDTPSVTVQPVCSVLLPAPSDPLLCKFADGGPKKRQNQGKFVQNGRAWPRNGDMVGRPEETQTPKALTWGGSGLGLVSAHLGGTRGQAVAACYWLFTRPSVQICNLQSSKTPQRDLWVPWAQSKNPVFFLIGWYGLDL